MTTQMSCMNAWNKEEMDGDILGNATIRDIHLFTRMQKNPAKEVHVFYFKTARFVSEVVLNKSTVFKAPPPPPPRPLSVRRHFLTQWLFCSHAYDK